MRIVHTSDWHVGRRWKGLQRLDEMETIIDNLACYIERESIDLVLHSGDVFDSRTPTGEAERLVNEFLVRVSRTGARTVVIAGNHDDPQRFDARALLAAGANVHILGRPRSADRGGTFAIETSNGRRSWSRHCRLLRQACGCRRWISRVTMRPHETGTRTCSSERCRISAAGIVTTRSTSCWPTRTWRGRSSRNPSAGSICPKTGRQHRRRCRRPRPTSHSATSTSHRGWRARCPPGTPARRCSSTSARWDRRRPSSSSKPRRAARHESSTYPTKATAVARHRGDVGRVGRLRHRERRRLLVAGYGQAPGEGSGHQSQGAGETVERAGRARRRGAGRGAGQRPTGRRCARGRAVCGLPRAGARTGARADGPRYVPSPPRAAREES